jgi:hypothetical protein
MTNYKHHGVRQYTLETLLKIRDSLTRNPLSAKRGTWECERLEAVRKEIAERMKP